MPEVKTEIARKEEPVSGTHLDSARSQDSQSVSQPASTVPAEMPPRHLSQQVEPTSTQVSNLESPVRPSQLPSEQITGAHTYRVFVVASNSVLHIQVIESTGRSTYLTFEG